MLNRVKYYYEYNKERLRGKARDKHRILSKEHKNKKSEYGKITIYTTITISQFI